MDISILLQMFCEHSRYIRGYSQLEQKSIVAKLDALSAEAKKLADLEELKKSVLKKAFSGEL